MALLREFLKVVQGNSGSNEISLFHQCFDLAQELKNNDGLSSGFCHQLRWPERLGRRPTLGNLLGSSAVMFSTSSVAGDSEA